MRTLIAFMLISTFLTSCGPGVKPEAPQKKRFDTVLRLPEIESGIAVDTTLSAMRIKAIVDTNGAALWLIESYSDSIVTDVVNVYADSGLDALGIGSLIEMNCPDKDFRLIGLNKGQELGIPFHSLHRFHPLAEAKPQLTRDFQTVYMDKDSNNMVGYNACAGSDMKEYFRSFYGDAFNPQDSGDCYPHRKPHAVTVDALMMEGQGWDATDLKTLPDTAQGLAAYNEFVNKLEIYDKVGSFYLLPVAMMQVAPTSEVSWGAMMKLFGEHHAVLKSLRESALIYQANTFANEGKEGEMKTLTEEDLRLLYPDRLRWNHWISGEWEHRYDPDLLNYYWNDPAKSEVNHLNNL